MKKIILLADDEEQVRTLLAATIGSNERYVLFEARDGIEALKVARQKKPDLILLDVLMPGMDGFEVCRQLKTCQDSKSAAVVMLTAVADEAERRKACLMGADGYFTKPFSPSALLRKLEEVLGY